MEPEEANPFLAFQFILLQTLGAPAEVTYLILGILGIIILLLCSALISGSEVAFFSLSPNDFEKLQNENDQSSKQILDLKDKPEMLLATILISNNFINIAIVVLSNFVVKIALPEERFEIWGNGLAYLFRNIGLPADPIILASRLSFLITIVGVTFLLVLFGEVAPKFYAKFNNIKLSKIMARPLSFLIRLFAPVSRILVSATSLIEKRLDRKRLNSGLTSREDIDEAIELTAINNAEIEQEADILKSIVKFGDVSVKQIMKSRIDVVAIDFRVDYSELLQVVKESGFSRIPVFDEDFDNVTGILYVKDLLGHLGEDTNFEWQELIRTNVLFIPESKKIDDLLKEFQQMRLHMAIVVDEYGGSSGIVTLEDILEEIIGEIKDEFDDDTDVTYKKLDDSNYIFEGKTLINDFCRIIGTDTSTFDDIKGDFDSLAGMILELRGDFPEKDAIVKYQHFTLKIVEVDKRRIQQILVTIEESGEK